LRGRGSEADALDAEPGARVRGKKEVEREEESDKVDVETETAEEVKEAAS